MKYDFIIRNGNVFHSCSGKIQVKDIYVRDGIIVEKSDEENVEVESENIIDAEGKYVLPGLIDEHAHLNLYGTMIGANADMVCIPNGVTTAVDGGTTGASGFELFYKHNIVSYETDVRAYLNVSTFGNKSLCKHEEDHDPADFREDLMAKLFRKYPDILKGVKVRMCKGTLGDYGMSPLLRAIEISNNINKLGFHCPIIVHYDDLPDNVGLEALVNILRPGDVLAHVFQTKGETIFDSNGKVVDCIKKAQERGIIMDSCNGRVHWSFEHLNRAFEDNFYPDIISSDLVRVSEYVRPGFSLIHAMCVFSAAGMEMNKIFKAVTYTPAKSLGILGKAGTLDTGSKADIAIIDVMDTNKVFYDRYGGQRIGNKMFIPLLTMKEGRVAYRQIYF
ncbi:amidohydrolase family protein [Petroclostridium sp. X23]|uniref:amidohydrolase family protein n=1 Tax=Petroclostridium sp. X23 TaxID=3045146 RepID=UPI0024AD8D0C|nr:amidohydrolase family protein [Petroclostridium sp. X23]WHH57985.1 amidohydrolase family protein [Petroclostridium sp. X23]